MNKIRGYNEIINLEKVETIEILNQIMAIEMQNPLWPMVLCRMITMPWVEEVVGVVWGWAVVLSIACASMRILV
jgi:hypothetical protein